VGERRDIKICRKEIRREGVNCIHVACSCESGNESSVSIKCGEFLEHLSDCQLLKRDVSPYSKLFIF
jgi:hypothetical protein